MIGYELQVPYVDILTDNLHDTRQDWSSTRLYKFFILLIFGHLPQI